MSLLTLFNSSIVTIVAPPPVVVATPDEKNNVVLSWPNLVESAILTSSQTFASTLPLENLKDPIINNVARATTTTLTVNFTFTEYFQVGAIALARHNLSSSATIRIKLFYDAGQTVTLQDSGSIPIWFGDSDWTLLDWEDDNFWVGNYTSVKNKDLTKLFYHYFDGNSAAVSGSITITDNANSDGFIEIGRLFIGPWFMTEENISEKHEYGAVTATKFVDCNDTRHFRRRRTKRTKTLPFDVLGADEAIIKMYQMQLIQGIDRELLYSETFTKNGKSELTSFLATLENLSPVYQQNFAYFSTGLNLTEVI